MSSVVERCRVKFDEGQNCLRFCRVLSSAFGQVLDFLPDIAELTHMHFIIFPTKLAVRKALPSKNSSKFCNIN